ncbi:MAG: thioredoxin family protein [Deltaproteobacteria bacterium]|nr:thioredoxin family protein [Deltaproteobacteria bacterium]
MINLLTEERLGQGLDYQAFRSRVNRNGEIFDEAWQESPVFSDADLATLRKLPPLTVVAIAEDWCPDVFHTLPTWAKLGELLPDWDCRIFPLDENPDLMEAFLYKGRAKRIPVYAFFDQRGYLQAWWSGRCRQAQEALDGHLGGRTFAELSAEEKSGLTEFLNAGYRESFRRQNFLEIMALLKAFFHVS